MESENKQKAEITCMEKAFLGNTECTNVNQDDRQEISASSWRWRTGRRYIQWLSKSKFPNTLNPGKCPSVECPSEWIGYKKKCYFISEEEKNWTSSQTFCAENASSLAIFENQEEMHSLAKLLKIDDCWIGLHKKGASFYWENGTALNVNLFPIQNHSNCAYLDAFSVSTSACSLPRRGICNRLP
ncbi:C-type lectin domain family 2 member B-like [Porphyrio hochstetteri]